MYISKWLLGLMSALFAIKSSATYLTDPNGMCYFFAQCVYPNNKNQMDIGSFFQYAKANQGKAWFNQVVTDYGLTDQIVLSADIQLIDVILPKHGSAVKGIGDADITAQYSLVNFNQTNASLAYGMNIEIPTGSVNRGLTDGLLQYEPFVAAAYNFGDAQAQGQFFGDIQLSLVQRIRRPHDRNLQVPAAHSILLNGGYNYRTTNINYILEMDWQNNRWNHHGNINQLYATPGVHIQVNKSTEVALATPVGLNKTSATYQVILIGYLYFYV